MVNPIRTSTAMPPTLIRLPGYHALTRSLRISTLTLGVLCAGCQSYEQAGTPRVERTPRLVAGLNQRLPSSPRITLPVYDGEDVWARLGQGCTLLETSGSNQRIERQRDWLLGNPAFLTSASERAGPYLHFIVERLDERQMPVELALLPIMESAYNPYANSPKNAAGLWQFMAATGRDFNLRQTASYDGRRDVLASSKAAMDYLTRLHAQFGGDWLLALAAYNAGEGTVGRAIESNRRQGLATDYWHLTLPRETQDYVPRLLALSLLVRDRQAYGVQLSPVANTPYFEVVELSHPVDITRLAARAGIDAERLLGLNPAYLRRNTADGPGQLLVPRDAVQVLTASLARGDRDDGAAQAMIDPPKAATVAEVRGVKMATPILFDKRRPSVSAVSDPAEKHAMRASSRRSSAVVWADSAPQ
jgi:membrane-bound lytic murein transglycosylase D